MYTKMKITCLQPYQQPEVELLVMSSSRICEGSGDTTFNPSHFDFKPVEW